MSNFYEYPTDITSKHNVFMLIESHKVMGKSVEQKNENRNLATVQANAYALPMPTSGIQDEFNTDWDMINASFAQGNVGQIGADIAKGIASQYSDLNSLIKGSTGIAIDTNTMPAFNAIEHRTFSFTWELYPRTKQDSDNLRNMVNALKKDTLPGKNTGNVNGIDYEVLTYPNIFYIKIGGVDESSLPKFSKYGYICTSINIGYNNGGTWYQFANGEPVNIVITMSFTERRRMTKELYEE